jgi:hypothetical protein
MSESSLPDWEQEALANFDELYRQPSGESAFHQFCVQLANPVPYDLEQTDLTEYRRLHRQWQDWITLRKSALR